MRIAIVGNLAGWGLRRAEPLHRAGLDVTVFVSAYEKGTSKPAADTRVPVRVWTWPARREWDGVAGPRSVVRRLGVGVGVARLGLSLTRFDVVHTVGAVAGYGIGIHRGLVVEPLGADVVELANESGLRPALLRAAWRAAGAMVVANGETLRAAELLGFHPRFLPIAADLDKYDSSPSDDADCLRVLHPARHDWTVRQGRQKATDVLLRGVAEYLRSGGRVALRLVHHGRDIDASRRLIEELGIADVVSWSPLLTPEELIMAFHTSHVVADQFVIGSLGGIGVEALASGRPLITHLAEDFSRTYGEAPPYFEASSPGQVADALAKAAIPSIRRDMGAAARRWAKVHHDPRKVVDAQVALYEEVARRGTERNVFIAL